MCSKICIHLLYRHTFCNPTQSPWLGFCVSHFWDLPFLSSFWVSALSLPLHIHKSHPLVGPPSQSPHPVSTTSPHSPPAPRPKKDVPSKTAKSLSAAAETLMKNSRGVPKMFAAANTRTRPPGSGGAASAYTDADLESVLADVTVDDLDRQKLRQKRKGALSPFSLSAFQPFSLSALSAIWPFCLFAVLPFRPFHHTPLF